MYLLIPEGDEAGQNQHHLALLLSDLLSWVTTYLYLICQANVQWQLLEDNSEMSLNDGVNNNKMEQQKHLTFLSLLSAVTHSESA